MGNQISYHSLTLTLVRDIYPGQFGGTAYGSKIGEFMVVGNTLFFVADDRSHGKELWKTDGTSGGTVMVKDIRTDGYQSPFGWITNDSNPSGLTNVNGTLFFSVEDGSGNRELWKSDGTQEGTVLLGKNINPESYSIRSSSEMICLGDKLAAKA